MLVRRPRRREKKRWAALARMLFAGVADLIKM